MFWESISEASDGFYEAMRSFCQLVRRGRWRPRANRGEVIFGLGEKKKKGSGSKLRSEKSSVAKVENGLVGPAERVKGRYNRNAVSLSDKQRIRVEKRSVRSLVRKV